MVKQIVVLIALMLAQSLTLAACGTPAGAAESSKAAASGTLLGINSSSFDFEKNTDIDACYVLS